MRRIFIILSIVSVLPFAANAQLSKLMSKYHEKNGVTVTQLDKSLYGLYQRNNLPPEANELLQKLEEVNILNLDLNQTDPSLSEKAIGQFREILDKPEKIQTDQKPERRVRKATDLHAQQKRTSDRPGGLEPKPTTSGYHRTPGRHSTG